jgi:hypothetical protein
MVQESPTRGEERIAAELSLKRKRQGKHTVDRLNPQPGVGHVVLRWRFAFWDWLAIAADS